MRFDHQRDFWRTAVAQCGGRRTRAPRRIRGTFWIVFSRKPGLRTGTSRSTATSYEDCACPALSGIQIIVFGQRVDAEHFIALPIAAAASARRLKATPTPAAGRLRLIISRTTSLVMELPNFIEVVTARELHATCARARVPAVCTMSYRGMR